MNLSNLVLYLSFPQKNVQNEMIFSLKFGFIYIFQDIFASLTIIIYLHFVEESVSNALIFY